MSAFEKPFFLDKVSLLEYRKQVEIINVLDTYEEQLKELFLIRNPRFRFDLNYENDWQSFLTDHLRGRSLDECGQWFFFPWSKSLVHYLSEDMHLEMRTARNRNIINEEEQKKIYNSSIAIAGLSVGSHPAFTMAIMGMVKKWHLADPDIISGSNLNRIRTDVTQIGESKCFLITRQIYQINPYAEILVYDKGVDDSNIVEFLSGVDILVEEVDNLAMKIRLRLEAKKYKIPVLMATDNGDNVIVDVERYDLHSDLKIFNGVVGDLTLEDFLKIPPAEMPRLATKIAGPKLITSRMQESLLEVGKSIYSWPQTGDAATLAGVAIAYVAKRILIGEQVCEGKMEINLDAIFDPDYNLDKSVQQRNDQRGKFLQTIGLEDSQLQSDIKKVILAGARAPSGDNSQPWRFRVKSGIIESYNLPEKDNPIFNYKQRGSHVAHGALLENMKIVAAELGYDTKIKLFPNTVNDNLVSQLVLEKGSVEVKKDVLYQSIFQRAINRKKYSDTLLTDDQKTYLLNSVQEIGEGKIFLVDDSEKKKLFGQAVSKNEIVMLENEYLHNYFFRDVRWTEKEELKHKNGLYLKTMELSPPAVLIFKLLNNWKRAVQLNKIGISKFVAKQNAVVYASGSVVGVITVSSQGTPEEFILAGRLMERLWLKVNKLGLSFHPITGVAYLMMRILDNTNEVLSTEHIKIVKDSFEQIKQVFGLADETIVLPFRIGNGGKPSGQSSRLDPEIIFE
ncbi:MAG: hypothetical protein AUJ23_00280 [Candidatus Magasanikbacteria bacterium CG1_02_32_51]|uniref:THIF-type NAD/FAD binding fold domain-containing protein n=2 Tax=Candidatus Magasanikiibacteriota TaxID=1752731 RepID=A0A1J4UD92_9BACT|nr:MAG: hypothetical protein AUJ23_00280 [Candidatus Magasanikbacteria bacterium CG1_02_32_51]